MANESRKDDRSPFDGLTLPNKAFELPSISSPWLSQEPTINHHISDHTELESHPTSILDGSCVVEVMNKPSVPLVKSVVYFALGCVTNPVGSHRKPNVDLAVVKHKGIARVMENVDFSGPITVKEESRHN